MKIKGGRVVDLDRQWRAAVKLWARFQLGQKERPCRAHLVAIFGHLRGMILMRDSYASPLGISEVCEMACVHLSQEAGDGLHQTPADYLAAIKGAEKR